MSSIVIKIISGGQTGVDRAALDVALELGLPCGGWCPQGRVAEDGEIARRYPLRETPTADDPQRTQWNVRDSDGTLVLTRGRPITHTHPQARQDAPLPGNGTAFTIEVAARLNKPCLVLDLTACPDVSVASTWTEQRTICILNVAGPRESTFPGIYDQARSFLRAFLTASSSR